MAEETSKLSDGAKQPAPRPARPPARAPAGAPAAPAAKTGRSPSRASSAQQELDVLIRARYPIIYVVTWEEERV
jgi:hypothetical protein